MPRTLTTEFQTASGAAVKWPSFLFEIEVDIAGNLWRICTGDDDIEWKSNTYTHYPIKHDGLKQSVEGDSPSFKMSISNVDQTIGAYVLQNNANTIYGMRDRKIRIILIYSEKNPANNKLRPLTNADSFIDFIYNTSASNFQCEGNTRIVNLYCKSKMETEDAELPGRLISRDVCYWDYRDRGGCKYAGNLIKSAIIYDTGNITIANGSTAVTGSGTSWLGKVAGKDVLKSISMSIKFDDDVTDTWYELQAVPTDTSITLDTAYTGATISTPGGYEIRFTDFCSLALDDQEWGCAAHQNTANFGAQPGTPDYKTVSVG